VTRRALAATAAPNRSSRRPRPAASKGLGKLRYVVERNFATLNQFRRLAMRWERRLDILDGFVSLAAALICAAERSAGPTRDRVSGLQGSICSEQNRHKPIDGRGW
jgi:transposase